MTIVYRYGRNVYVNLTNKCPCDCTFCYRNLSDSIGDGDNLWLEREPTANEVVDALRAYDLSGPGEVVFCGYGEPTERLDVLLDVARRIRPDTKRTIRLDTNGLGCIINGRDIVPDLAGVLDSISVSLNASSAEEYGALCRPEFGGDVAYAEVLRFIESCRDVIPAVTVSVVGGTIDSGSEERCRDAAKRMGVRFRVR